jgi:hypothetical protein
VYAGNVLANAYNLSRQGEYELAVDWSYGLIEDSQQEFSQMMQAESKGIVSKVEIRQWLNPDETLEEAEQKIREIKESDPSVEELLGGDPIQEEEYRKQRNDRIVNTALNKMGL